MPIIEFEGLKLEVHRAEDDRLVVTIDGQEMRTHCPQESPTSGYG